MNDLAEELIDRLRNDPYTRQHFDMTSWASINPTCNTVGCIAGTAIFLANRNKRTGILDGDMRLEVLVCHPSNDRRGDMIKAKARELLGIRHSATATDLFLPYDHKARVLHKSWGGWDYLSPNERPDLTTVERMKEWARTVPLPNDSPDYAALALERIVKDEIPYCDWSFAVEMAD